jgi:hypothetical protein
MPREAVDGVGRPDVNNTILHRVSVAGHRPSNAPQCLFIGIGQQNGLTRPLPSRNRLPHAADSDNDQHFIGHGVILFYWTGTVSCR